VTQRVPFASSDLTVATSASPKSDLSTL
jgi:hypothetical protein